MGIIILFIVIVAIAAFRFNVWQAAHWDRGEIPPFFQYNPDNEMEVIIALSGLIIRKDFRNLGEKRRYLNHFFKQNFHSQMYDYSDSLRHSYRNPIKVDSAAAWFVKNKAGFQYKLNIVQLLINISMQDGELNTPEFETLKYIHTSLRLPIEEFDRLISVHIIEQQRRQEEARDQEKHYSSYSKVSKREHCFKILGIQQTSDETIIKKAYRTLAKQYHPDRFQNENPLQKKMSNDKFIAIQTAYDYLIENG